MLTHLHWIWSNYQSGFYTTRKTDIELRMWTSQYCVDADNFAFSLAGAMLQQLDASVGYRARIHS